MRWLKICPSFRAPIREGGCNTRGPAGRLALERSGGGGLRASAASARERVKGTRGSGAWHVCRARVREVAHRRATRCQVVPIKQSMVERPTQAAAVQCGRWWIRWPTHAEASENRRMCTQITVMAMRVRSAAGRVERPSGLGWAPSSRAAACRAREGESLGSLWVSCRELCERGALKAMTTAGGW